MNRVTLTTNGTHKTVELDTPLLWGIRDHLHLTGTKFGCGGPAVALVAEKH